MTIQQPAPQPHDCGHIQTVRGCGGCDPGAIDYVITDDGIRRPFDPPRDVSSSGIARERKGRYHAAIVSGPGALEAVLRLVDAELAEAAKPVERVTDLADVWESVEPDGLMSRRRAAAILREVVE